MHNVKAYLRFMDAGTGVPGEHKKYGVRRLRIAEAI